jgi:hypothetical protein
MDCSALRSTTPFDEAYASRRCRTHGPQAVRCDRGGLVKPQIFGFQSTEPQLDTHVRRGFPDATKAITQFPASSRALPLRLASQWQIRNLPARRRTG